MAPEQTPVLRHALVLDGDGLVGRHLAARLRGSSERVFHVSPHRGTLGDVLPPLARVDEVWLFPDGGLGLDPFPTHAWLETLASGGATEINVVMEGQGPGQGRIEIERDFADRCVRAGLGYRIFRTSPILPDPSAEPAGALDRFLTTLFVFEREIEERAPAFFDYHALRCYAPGRARIDLVGADAVAERALLVSRTPDTLNRGFTIAGSHPVPLEEFCARVRAAFGSTLLPVADRASLTTIDLAFEERLHRPWGGLLGTTFAADTPWPEAPSARDEVLDGGALEVIRKHLAARRDLRERRVAGMPGSLERTTIEHKGGPLTYYAAGSGATPILCLNAIGQPIDYWFRLIDDLSPRHRVVVWEPRGATVSPHPFTLEDQVDDVEAVLRNEGVSRCRLVGWCTGPKVAVEFALRHPAAVSAMVFLNPTFRCAGTSPELETAYERNSEPLFRAIAQRPAMAASVRKSLQAAVVGSGVDVDGESDVARLAVEVLSAMNAALGRHVTAPFQSESVIVHYSRQIVDFWGHDSLAGAERVQARVLLLASEYDRVASPAMAREAARRFPRWRYVLMPFATHYCLHDRPEFVAALIDDFLGEAEPAAMARAHASTYAGARE